MTVADIIGMTTFGSQPHGYPPRDVDVPAPDGQVHAVVLKRGDVERNTNTFVLVLFRTDGLFAGGKGDTVLTLTSSSNRPAITNVTWLSDNRTVAFLGEHEGELPQVYTLDVTTRALTARTHERDEITNFAIAPTGDPIVYTTAPARDTSSYANMRRRGFALRSGQFIGDVMIGAWTKAPGQRFLIQHAATGTPLEVAAPGPYRTCDPNWLSVAPHGRVALLKCQPWQLPVEWLGYTEEIMAKWVRLKYVPFEFAVLDLEHATIGPLIRTPVLWGTTVQWAPSGQSAVFANAYLPLTAVDSTERERRIAGHAAAEVEMATGHVTVLAHRDSLEAVSWDPRSNTVDFLTGQEGKVDGPRVRYQKIGQRWRPVASARAVVRPVLVVTEALNSPERLEAVDPGRSRRATLLDPNPQLSALRLTSVQIAHWHTRSGDARMGGLYLPLDYRRGQRYPLVIQTHGFDSTAFAPDGPFPTANAAQPLAGLGMVVLQLGVRDHATWVRSMMTPQEPIVAMEEIESAIDYLDSLGLIDRSRVGISGFSRSCFTVLYTLTHSSYPIAAAAVTDGVDESYLQYLLFENTRLESSQVPEDAASINGGPPFGSGLRTWMERAPGFNLDRLTAPLRLEAIGLPAVLEEWEPFSGLVLQRRPAEMFLIPDGVHLLVKPWERLASAEGNADWFRYWLKGEEDPDPAKAGQYMRWRELRKLQQSSKAAG